MKNLRKVLKKNLIRLLCGGMLFISMVMLSSELYGQSTPKFSNEFLSIGVGARALAMSNAMTASVDDVTAVFWNPAALTDIDHRYEFSLQHASYFGGIANYDYVGFAYAIDQSSHFGISLIRLGIDDIPDTRFLFDTNGAIDFDQLRFFTSEDVALIISYARGVTFGDGRPFAQGLTFGANFKIIKRKLGDFADAWGFGLDVSAKYRLYAWDLGLTIRDVTTTFNSWTINQEALAPTFSQTGNDIPANSLEITLPKIYFGASRSFSINDKIDVLTAADLVFTFDGRRNTLVDLKNNVVSFDPQFGFEFDYEDRFFFRLGIGNFQRIENFDRDINGGETTFLSFQPNMGLGVKLDDFIIDYALTDIGNVAESPYSHVFSIKYSLDKLPGIYSQNKRKTKKVKETRDEN